jgi:hypothetical protein
MRVNADRRRLPPRIYARLPNALTGLEAHHVRGRGRLGSRLNFEGSAKLVRDFMGGDRVSDAALSFGDGYTQASNLRRDPFLTFGFWHFWPAH